MAAIAIWEAAKAGRWALFSEREQRRGDRLRRFRRRVAEAVRRELERANDDVGSGSSDDSGAVRRPEDLRSFCPPRPHGEGFKIQHRRQARLQKNPLCRQ